MRLSLLIGLFLPLFIESNTSECNSWRCQPSKLYSISGKMSPYLALDFIAPDGKLDPSYSPVATNSIELYSTMTATKIGGVNVLPFSSNCPSSCLTTITGLTVPINLMSQFTGFPNKQKSSQLSTSFNVNWVAPTGSTAVSFWSTVDPDGDTYEKVSNIFQPAVNITAVTTYNRTGMLMISALKTDTPRRIVNRTGKETPLTDYQWNKALKSSKILFANNETGPNTKTHTTSLKPIITSKSLSTVLESTLRISSPSFPIENDHTISIINTTNSVAVVGLLIISTILIVIIVLAYKIYKKKYIIKINSTSEIVTEVHLSKNTCITITDPGDNEV